jgi:ATP-dependent Clp protease ATP-binding subunit ClpC
VGKSELAKTLAEFLFGSKDALIRMDMSEFMEKHTVSRLIGSPPGYVGFNEGGQLTEPVRRKPYSVVLFDEIEKASPDILNILLQILEDGRLTDATGRTVSFKNTFIIMTSNVGGKYIQQQTSFGFVDAVKEHETQYEAIKVKMGEELRREFRPEFLNRIDDIIIFKSLVKDDIRLIIDIMLAEVVKRVAEKLIYVTYDDAVKTLLVDKGFDQKLGARPLRRAIQEHFEDRLADKVLQEGLDVPMTVAATVEDGLICFTVQKQKKAKLIKPKSDNKELIIQA